MERYTYSDAERDKILGSALTLFRSTFDDINDEWSTLAQMRKKKLRFSLHATSLTDYWKNDIIPRGLRVQKGLAMFKSDQSFITRWTAILNKCSYDLMLVLIEHFMYVVSATDNEIEKLTETLK